MIPVYSAKKLKEWDQFTIQNKHISSIDLMETAANQFLNWFISTQQIAIPILVFCGNGNNGGDGLAIARLLNSKSYKPKVVLINVSEKNSPDFESNLSKLKMLDIEIFNSKLQVIAFIQHSSNLLLIDAILGYGLNRDVHEDLLEWFRLINESKLIVHAVDVPSGMYIDQMILSECVHANATFTFQNPKLCHLIPETGSLCGSLHIGNIDLDSEFVVQNPSKHNYLELKDIQNLYQPRSAFNWKNKYGHLLIVGGSLGMAGAILLSANAALRSGSGLCSIHSEESNREIIQMTLPEAMFINDINLDFTKFSSLVIGPGMGMKSESKNKLKFILNAFNKPIILDADALNVIASEKWYNYFTSNCILTPHVGEFDRLFGKCSNGFERLEKAIEICAKYNIHIILKGKYTAIVTPDKYVYFNSTGNPGLAKGGSGDVLSGMLGSFLAQGYSILNACLLAVYMHGLAADIAKEQLAEESIFPTDIIQNISNAFLRIAT